MNTPMPDALDDLCQRCGCCITLYEPCGDCGGEGEVSRYEEDPLYYDEDELFKCEGCDGQKGVLFCLGKCDENGSH